MFSTRRFHVYTDLRAKRFDANIDDVKREIFCFMMFTKNHSCPTEHESNLVKVLKFFVFFFFRFERREHACPEVGELLVPFLDPRTSCPPEFMRERDVRIAATQ